MIIRNHYLLEDVANYLNESFVFHLSPILVSNEVSKFRYVQLCQGISYKLLKENVYGVKIINELNKSASQHCVTIIYINVPARFNTINLLFRYGLGFF